MPLNLGLGLGIGRVGSASAAAALLAGYSDGLAFSALDDSMVVKDTTTPANNYVGDLRSKLGNIRSGNAYRYNEAGLLELVANTLRLDYDPRLSGGRGYLVEMTRTNVVRWNRDLTNAAWTKTNCTAAKDQTGPDGVANSASSLTAAGANATCLQAITLSSSARYQSCFIKRLTGSGVVEMTMDNGATWTAVTVTAAWAPVEIPTQTLANPTVGFRIVTSGDAVAIDFVQNENGAFRTSPIATTSASVTRASDQPQLSGSAYPAPATEGTLYTRTIRATDVDTSYLTILRVGSVSAQSYNLVYQSNLCRAQVTATTDQALLNAGSPVLPGGTDKLAMAFATDDVAASHNGAAVLTDVSATMPTPDGVLQLGYRSSGGSGQINGWLIENMILPRRVSNAQLPAITA